MLLSEQQRRILTAMGTTLIVLQATERIIKLCMTFVFQNRSPLTLEELERQQKEERKKTVGYFLAELRKRANLDTKFDQMLRDFLDHRNTFIHKLDHVQGWDLDTSEGRQVAGQFISKLASLNRKVLLTFSGFLRAWQKQIGMDVPIPPGSEELFVEIDRVYTPLIDDFLFKKDA